MAYTTFHDISYAQGQYNMDADKSPIVFMKMSGYYYGSKQPYYDVQAARNYQNAVRLGKIPGLYHFAGGADPVAEADFFVGACSPLAEGDILILDYELTGDMNPPADPNDWCLKFVERVKERTGKYPLFYTYYAMLKQYGFSEVLKRCGLWIAHYGVSPDQDIPNCPPYIIHQYQGTPLDTNACFISLETLKKYGYSSSQPQSNPPAVPAPVVTTTTVTETQPVAYNKVAVDNPLLPKGETKVSEGSNGVRTLTYTITLTNGVETGRTLVSDEITVQPVTEITSVGTYEAPPKDTEPDKDDMNKDDELVDQPTSAPTEKVKAVAIAGSVITAAVGILAAFGVVVPESVSDNALTIFSGLFTAATFLVAYLKRNKASDK